MSEAYDYVIVGAGSSGCALAARLAEDPAIRVLLLEAGGRDLDPAIHIPAGIVRLIGNPRVDWSHLAEPDPSRDGKVDLWPAGRVLGGSSSINGMLFVRGAPADYDGWAKLGNPGWSYEDVLPAFRRMENAEGGDDALRGRRGPLHVQLLRTRHQLGRAFEAAAAAAGLPLNPDYNGAEQDGIAPPQVTQYAGRRWSAARAYLGRRPANLRLITGAEVSRVVIENGRAAGVAYRRGGGEHVARGGEVILSAGALASPRLLMLSGVGPAADLAALGIPVVRDSLEVGHNLAEHPNANLSWDVRLRTYNVEVAGPRMALHLARWALFRRGPATSPYPHAVGFFRSSPELEWPDIQIMFGPFAFGFSEAGIVPYLKPAVTVVATLQYPKARGRLSLRSPDPHAKPVIEHALLGEPEDVARLTAACRFARTIMAQPAIARDVVGERLPGPATTSDADWADHLRRTTFLGYHPVGTARMGPDGVVDERLRVRGVDGLRIVDASIMPTPVSGNTNAAAIMIGERAAEFVREDRR